jgi:tetratricopeptide (TPR) repeat protein
VKARVGRRLLSSPAVGFWVTDPESLRDVEIGEREYHDSALARAALYERHGLYEEALAEVERLNKANPKSPATQEMLRNLHSKLGMNGTEE